MERVLVCQSSLLDDLGRFQGYTSDSEKYISAFLSPNNLLFVDRDAAEVDPNYKQIIPYIVIRVGNLYLTYERTKKGKENRLHGKFSIGIGGHVNEVDKLDGEIAYILGFFRELNEETGILIKDSRVAMASIVGLINDDSDDVGKVHLGIVHLLELPEGQPLSMKDPAISQRLFMSKKNLMDTANSFENWSKLVLPNLPD